jgi:hypothetical protein
VVIIVDFNVMVGNRSNFFVIYRWQECGWVDNIKMDLREMVWTGSNWLRIGTSGGLL